MGSFLLTSNLILLILLGILYLWIILPYQSLIIRRFGALLLVLLMFLVIFKTIGLVFIPVLFFLSVVLWSFLASMRVGRKYIYISFLFFAGASFTLFILEIQGAAEFLGALAPLFLVLGVVKDIFFEDQRSEI